MGGVEVNTNDSTNIDAALAPVAKVYDEYRPLMEGVRILPRAPSPASMPAELALRHKQTQRLIFQNGLSMPFLGYAPLFSGTKAYVGKDSDWALMNLSLDPLFRSQGNNLYAPLSVVNDVQLVVNSGINLDAIFIAHEVPKGAFKPGQEVPVDLITPAPSAKVQRRLNFLGRTSTAWWKLVTRTSVGAVAVPAAAGAATVIAGTALISAAAASASKAVASASAAAEAAAERRAAAAAERARAAAEAAAAERAARYDPALLGVQFDPRWLVNGQPAGLWYFITSWVW
jgi:hypothetical protein